MPCCTPRSCNVRINSSPVRSPTWHKRLKVWPPNARCRICPSSVRSNSAPHCSSSRTRSGASCAWSCAMRQLLRNFPPRMVSRKCVRQSSALSTLPIAAAIPPSAMTVCALPSSDLHTRPTRAPCARPTACALMPIRPLCQGFNRGAESGTARADDQYIVFVGFVGRGHRIRTSLRIPAATMRM